MSQEELLSIHKPGTWEVGYDGPSRPIILSPDIPTRMFSISEYSSQDSSWGSFDDESEVADNIVKGLNLLKEVTTKPEPTYLVKLTYFKLSGKYYFSVEYISQKASLLDIWDEIKIAHKSGKLPGLIEGHSSDFVVLVEVPAHPHSHPKIIGMGL